MQIQCTVLLRSLESEGKKGKKKSQPYRKAKGPKPPPFLFFSLFFSRPYQPQPSSLPVTSPNHTHLPPGPPAHLLPPPVGAVALLGLEPRGPDGDARVALLRLVGPAAPPEVRLAAVLVRERLGPLRRGLDVGRAAGAVVAAAHVGFCCGERLVCSGWRGFFLKKKKTLFRIWLTGVDC
ncbi:hypothetical protein VTK56DRAFT_5220 [Thermocarpiscus australiensis]